MKISVLSWHRSALNIPLDERSLSLRRKIVEVLSHSKRGHLGASFSLVEILRVLYDDILRYDSATPRWEGRDRFILSKGHGCLALYVLLAEKGFFPEQHLQTFCSKGSILGGHPNSEKVAGVEAATGSLGHGLSLGVGMAVNARYEKSGARVFVVVGDGECDEGSIWEAAMCAGKYGLSNLTVLVDYNKFQSYDAVSQVQELEPFRDKWRAFGFATVEVNGHDTASLKESLENLPLQPDKPSAVICHTIKGKGVPFAENNLTWHHKSGIDEDQVRTLMECLGASVRTTTFTDGTYLVRSGSEENTAGVNHA